jgi:acetyl-CoA C-acetyltransferase
MATRSIRDKVAIVGMGCTPFGDHFDRSGDDLLVQASSEALDTAELKIDDIDAFFFGTVVSGVSGLALSRPLRTGYKPVSRTENMCATATDALRQAVYAVAAGACDVAMAIGMEKLKDYPYAGMPNAQAASDGTRSWLSSPAAFSFIVPAYAAKYDIDAGKVKDAISRIAWKNHRNGARNPRAAFRREVPIEQICSSPTVAGQLGVFDCSGLSDGSAAAIVVPAEDADRYPNQPIYVKAVSLIAGPGDGSINPNQDFTTFPEVVRCAEEAYAQAGISDPRAELCMAEVHDCFTPTELVLMEDLGFSERGQAWEDVLAGCFDLEGELPVNTDGGLKSFGHPIGASGLRMVFEAWLQLRGEAGERQVTNGRTTALTHNLGGEPGSFVSALTLLGSERG